jgi:epoxyqueuosine reductase
VCPWNKKGIPFADKELIPDFPVTSLTKKEWLSLTTEEFKTIFRSSPLKRTGFEKIRRNIDFVDHRSPEER